MKDIKKIGLRFWVIFLIQLIIKSFDRSFGDGPFSLTFRSILFTVFFVLYGLMIWYLADFFNARFKKWIKNIEHENLKIAGLTFLHAVVAFLFVLGLNHLYRFGDITLFGEVETWSGTTFFNPELTVSLMSFYLLVLGFDSYFETQRNLQNEILKARELEKENLLAQYKALKAQIEPHFLFNSLSVLSSLVYKDADLSADFIVKLSRTLRYIIEKNEFHLVRLSEEIEFLEAYFFLIKMRLDDGVFLENKLDEAITENTFLPPVTLQLLVENAVNHNKYNPEDPLKIQISNDENFIVVKNNLNPRIQNEPSTRTGLKNLGKRYELVSNKKVIINKTSTEFVVKIPLLNTSDYERFNF